MKIVVDTTVKLPGGSGLREKLRLSLIGHGLSTLGCQVQIIGPFLKDEMAIHFQHLCKSTGNPDFTIQSAESVGFHPRMQPIIAVKTSVGCDNDRQMLKTCRLLVAHEYNKSIEKHKRLLPVPFMVSHKMMQQFNGDGVFSCYMNDDIGTLREKYSSKTKSKTPTVGFWGFGEYDRKVRLRGAPEWVHADYSGELSIIEYIQKITECWACLNMSGDTPKSYRQSELALFGVVGVEPQCPILSTPRVTSENSIVMADWSDWMHVLGVLSDKARVSQLQEGVMRAYLGGWSPIGQARQILSAIRAS